MVANRKKQPRRQAFFAMVLATDPRRISSRDSLTLSVTVMERPASSGHVITHSSILHCFSKNFDGIFDEILVTKEVLLPEFQRFGPPWPSWGTSSFGRGFVSTFD
jgi:hypothetical protein